MNKSQYGRARDIRGDVFEYILNNCYIPTSGDCFIKCGKHLTGKSL